ncbi:MAG: 2-oxoglutarate oxidoreductase [Deltaproteobacteria bacterium]|nr:2-oxoglutarate oxidoreductase [Deltaproteobacteria bacterium]
MELKFEQIAGFPKSLSETPQHFCPGCTHGVNTRLIAEAIDDLQVAGDIVGVCGMGCSALLPDYLDIDMVAAPPGQAIPVAVGLSHEIGEKGLVFVYLGEGDLYGRGLSALFHAAIRGESLSVFCANNLNMGMSGGHLSPTSLLGQKTATTPNGKSTAKYGVPVDFTRLLLNIPGVSFVARFKGFTAGEIRKGKELFKRSLQIQKFQKGFSFVEILGICPTNLELPPPEAVKQVKSAISDIYPSGIFKTPEVGITL